MELLLIQENEDVDAGTIAELISKKLTHHCLSEQSITNGSTSPLTNVPTNAANTPVFYAQVTSIRK